MTWMIYCDIYKAFSENVQSHQNTDDFIVSFILFIF